MRSQALIEAQERYENKNKEKRRKQKIEKVYCKYCDSNVAASNVPRHKRSKKHIKNMV